MPLASDEYLAETPAGGFLACGRRCLLACGQFRPLPWRQSYFSAFAHGDIAGPAVTTRPAVDVRSGCAVWREPTVGPEPEEHVRLQPSRVSPPIAGRSQARRRAVVYESPTGERLA